MALVYFLSSLDSSAVVLVSFTLLRAPKGVQMASCCLLVGARLYLHIFFSIGGDRPRFEYREVRCVHTHRYAEECFPACNSFLCQKDKSVLCVSGLPSLLRLFFPSAVAPSSSFNFPSDCVSPGDPLGTSQEDAEELKEEETSEDDGDEDDDEAELGSSMADDIQGGTGGQNTLGEHARHFLICSLTLDYRERELVDVCPASGILAIPALSDLHAWSFPPFLCVCKYLKICVLVYKRMHTAQVICRHDIRSGEVCRTFMEILNVWKSMRTFL